MAQARRRPPPAGARRPPGGRRPPPPAEEEYYEEEVAPAQPPAWERVILSKSFRLVVGSTFAAAALAVVVFLVGPSNIGRTFGTFTSFISRQGGRVVTLGAVAISSTIQDEGRRLWSETATPLPTGTATATPEPTHTPFPTPLPPRRQVDLPPTPPSKPIPIGQPQQKPPSVPALPYDAAVAAQREYFAIVSDGDVRRAMQYWAAETAPEARSALDAAVARGERYVVKNIAQRPLTQFNGIELTADMTVTDSAGKDTNVIHRYQWRFVDNQWFITARLQ